MSHDGDGGCSVNWKGEGEGGRVQGVRYKVELKRYREAKKKSGEL